MNNQLQRPTAGGVRELYHIYRKKDLRSNESRDPYQVEGYLVPSPRCGFCFQAVFKLGELNLTFSVYLENATVP